MKILEKFKFNFPLLGKSAQPKPTDQMEKAVTRNGFDHVITSIDYDLNRKVSSMDGWVEDTAGTRTNVSWSSLGLAYCKNQRVRQYDLVIKEAYEAVC